MSDVGRTLAELRKRAGLTQESLAEALGVTQQTISRTERGKRPPTWRFLTKLAEALHEPVNKLLSLAGLIPESATDDGELAAMVAAYPDLAAVFEFARKDRALLSDLARFARALIAEKRLEQQVGGASTGDSGTRD